MGVPDHIYPIEDSKPHVFTNDCPCSPCFIEENGQPLVVHNSYDLREFWNQEIELFNETYLKYTGTKPIWARGGRC